MRALYAEKRVGDFLTHVMDRYDLVIALSSDIFLLQDISRADKELLISVPNNTLFVSGDGDYGGYTNGLYMGSVGVVRYVMMRWHMARKLTTLGGNYEGWLKRRCQDNGVVVRKLDNHSEGRSFFKIRHDGCLKKRAPWAGDGEELWKSNVTSCLLRSRVEEPGEQTCARRQAKRIIGAGRGTQKAKEHPGRRSVTVPPGRLPPRLVSWVKVFAAVKDDSHVIEDWLEHTMDSWAVRTCTCSTTRART